MSVAGPRPIVEQKFLDGRDGSGPFRASWTDGLWQVSGRNNVSYQRRCCWISLCECRTLGLDLFILLRTVVVVLFPANKGAY